ncbi:MAG: glycosyltransferase, partial [Sphingobacteriales bacterium]
MTFLVPVFNEEQVIPFFYQAVADFRAAIEDRYQVSMLFINDGSTDQTQEVLKVLAGRDESVRAVSFSRNFGKEAALFAGLEHSTTDIVIPIDVDLQDPLQTVHAMLEKYEQGFDVVLGKRIDRSSDGFLKKKSAEMFYRFHNKISTPKIEENVGDFRLMTRRVVDELVKLRETQLFMKGLLSWVGFKTAIVPYK